MNEWRILKDSGNKEYQNGNYIGAIEIYSRAIRK